MPIDEVFGTKGAALAREVSGLRGDAEMAAAVERFLTESCLAHWESHLARDAHP